MAIAPTGLSLGSLGLLGGGLSLDTLGLLADDGGAVIHARATFPARWDGEPLGWTSFGGGLVLDTDEAQLRKDQSPDLLNVDLDDADVSKRKGKAVYNASVPTGMDTERVRAVGAFYTDADARETLMHCGTKVYADISGNGDFDDAGDTIMTGLTGGVYADLIQYQKLVYFGNSADGLRAWPHPLSGAEYTPDITPTPAAPILSILTRPVNDFETGSWTTRNAANSGGGTMTAAKVASLFKEGTGSLQLTLPNTAMNEFAYNDLGAAIDLSQADALGIWVYQSAGHGAAFQVAVHDGTGNAFNWNLFPAFVVTNNQQWQLFRVPLNGLQASDRNGIQGLAIRFLGWGQTDAGVAATTLSYLYFDAAYALGPFPADTYQYYRTDTYADGTDTQQESAPSAVTNIVVSEDVPVYAIQIEANHPGAGHTTKTYRFSQNNDAIGTAKFIYEDNGAVGNYSDLTSDATLILENRADLVFGRSAPPKAATWALVRDRLWAGNCTDPNDGLLYPYRIFVSEFANVEAFGSTLNPTFLINGPGYLDLPEKDQIRRIIDFDGTAVIFTDRSVWTVEGTGFDNFSLQKRAHVGLLARNAVAVSGRHIFFYSTDGIRVLEPNRTNVGTFPCWRITEPVFSLLKAIPRLYRPDAAMGIDEDGCLHFSFAPAGGETNAIALRFDPRRPGAMASGTDPLRPGWTYYENWGFSCFVHLRGGDSDQGDLLGGDVGAGRVWRLRQDENGEAIETDDGSAIEWHYTTRVEDVGVGRESQCVWITGGFDPQPGETVYLTVLYDIGKSSKSAVAELPADTVGAQTMLARMPARRARYYQAQVSGSQSVSIRCHDLSLGIASPW